jgi:hypothetical protein
MASFEKLIFKPFLTYFCHVAKLEKTVFSVQYSRNAKRLLE